MHKAPTKRSREIDQLLLIARHYLRLASRVAARKSSVLAHTIAASTDQHVGGRINADELLSAHLASAAIRLATITEIERSKFQSYRVKFYDKKWTRKGGLTQSQIVGQIEAELEQHIHLLLRDHVAHEENDKSQLASDRRFILRRLTLGDGLSSLSTCMQTIEKRL